MAYPYYNPYSYYPFQTGQPSMPQQVQSPMQTSQIQSSMIWVSGEQEALSYPVAPNNAVALWDSTLPVVYVKQADASGKPVLKIFDIKERGGEKQAEKSEYATKNDLAELSASIDELKANYRALKKARRQEVEDDE